jgi:enoyl-CoA hydratase/carnithine racemase
VLHLDADGYRSFVADPFVGECVVGDGVDLVVVHDIEIDAGADLPSPGMLPVVVAVVGDRLAAGGPAHADLVVDEPGLDHLSGRVATCPIAATSLAVLLRCSERLGVEAALAAESAVYSTLQAGAEFAAWRGPTTPQPGDQHEPAVLVERDDDALTVTLNRPHRHNAVTRQLRDELCAALGIVLADDSITELRLVGAGPSFCSGGDLAEFGLRLDPAVGHRTRLAQSPARLLHRLRDRTTVVVHGATLGGGIEMAAFARTVVAHPDTTIGLPEVGLGLIPGAGGTVSITRRVGRQRCAALALATDSIDAAAALEWGLVDALDPGIRPAVRPQPGAGR